MTDMLPKDSAGSFRAAKNDDEVLSQASATDFEKNFYWNVDDERGNYKNKHDFDALHLDEGVKPTLDQLVHTCLAERQSKYILFEQGMWVEYRSNDMKWKMGRVNRVIKQPPDDWDFDVDGDDVPEERLEVSYNIGVEGVVYEDNIRAPTQGLVALFGKRPWLWQQFALLQLEKRVRFDLAHEYDFEQIDNFKFAKNRYEAWLNAEPNADFKDIHDSRPEVTQRLLRTNVLTPFDLMDFIVERKDEWDFNDPDISIYTYTGALGSGLLTLIAVMTVQILIPLVLLYNNMTITDGGPSKRFFVDQITFDNLNGKFLPDTDFDQFCQPVDSLGEGKVLIALVIVIYLLDVVPDSGLSFFRTSGGYRTTYSKINSLRNIVWEQNDDDTVQEIGFKVDRMMNTGYLCALYIAMLFILLNTPIVLDLILNALAIDFIHQIDERVADADWWDDTNRWIKAGTIELVIQGTLRLRVLESVAKICQEYDIDRKDYIDAVGGAFPLKNKTVARADDADRRYMTKKEVLFETVAQFAEEADDQYVLDEYRKKPAQFGLIDRVLSYCGRRKGVFERYPEFRVWSRWQKVLFLPRVPTEDPDLSRQITVTLGKSDFREFAEHIIRVLSFFELIDTVSDCFKYSEFNRIPVKLLIGLMEWFLYIVTILFPFVVLAALLFIPYCY